MPKKNYKNNKKQHNKLNKLTRSVQQIFRRNRDKTYTYKQISAILDLNNANDHDKIIKVLEALKLNKEIQEVERGKYKNQTDTVYYSGIIDITSSGAGYVTTEAFNDDVYIASNNINQALHNDEVEIYIYKRRKQGKLEGEVTAITKRAKTEYVGVIQLHDKFAFVIADSAKMHTDIFVPISKINGAKNGDKVLVTLEEWDKKADSPSGKVVQVLGKPGEHNTEIHSILAEYGLPHDFPTEVTDYANKLDTSITKAEIKKRRDMRDTLTFTIDPKDAKDFDDALSFKKLKNGLYEIGIHIADVSHYVQPGNILDEEAYNRATSVYLVDRVVPMLPEILSNNACSLRANEEKYTFSVVFQMNDEGEVKNQWFGRTVTYSDARFAYEEAQAIIEYYDEDNGLTAGETPVSFNMPNEVSLTGKPYSVKPELVEAILKLDQLAKIIRKRRLKAGAISFDKVEVKFNLDENNNPISVFFKSSKDANKLIEEFMLLANKKVAEFIGKQKPPKTFIYRVHDQPDDTKLNALQNIVSKFGYKLNLSDPKKTAKSLNGLLESVAGKKEQNLVDTLTIRSMSKAEYSTNNIGHYGLGFQYYSHFTSPIRRYPDVMAHRLLQKYLDGKNSASQKEFEEKCKHSSAMEYLATKAERDSIKYMQIRFMEDHQDEDFVGVISGVTEWGMYVEIIENKCEGLVRINDLKDDHYTFDPDQYALVGTSNKKTYQLGDEVIVRVKNTDLIKKHLDFYFIGPN